MHTKSKLLLILGIFAVLFSVYAFAVPFERNMTFWVGYLAEIIAILAEYPILQAAFREKSAKSKFYGMPLARLGYLYLGVQTVVSIALFPLETAHHLPAWLPILLCVGILAFAMVGLIGADFTREQVQSIETKQQLTNQSMANLRSQAAVLSALPSDQRVKESLQAMAEDFQYSDPVSNSQTIAIEQELDQMLLSLKAHLSQNTATVDEIGKIREKLSQRNEICKLAKA